LTRIVLASKNRGKIRELGLLLEDLPVELLSLDAFEGIPEVAEDGMTFLDNALKKAKQVSEYTGEIALADDSGLEVDFLGGKPGVHSARYAGEDTSDASNNAKLLEELAGVPAEKRGAGFVCVLALHYPDGRYETFEGQWRGLIHDAPLGTEGFGYDPVFYLPEYGMTVAQLPLDEKNSMSHRARALDMLKQYLQEEAQKEFDMCVRGDII
jgi:XTP/dITP diphosphohydrolase